MYGQDSDEVLLAQLGDLGVVVAEDGLEDGLGVLAHAGGAAPDLARSLAELRGNAEGGDVGADGLVLVGDPVAAGLEVLVLEAVLRVVDLGACLLYTSNPRGQADAATDVYKLALQLFI